MHLLTKVHPLVQTILQALLQPLQNMKLHSAVDLIAMKVPMTVDQAQVMNLLYVLVAVQHLITHMQLVPLLLQI